MKIFFAVFSFLFCLIKTFGQSTDTVDYPEVGKPMPDFTIRNIKYYPRTEATLGDFKGKWLLLDFWNINCGACIASFPYTNEIQKELGDKIQVILVGIQDVEGLIGPLYAKFKERQNLVLPCAFDSVLANRFDIFVAPHSILIDEKGIVRSITSSFNASDIKGFLSGTPPNLPQSYRRMHEEENLKDEHYDFKSERPFLINGNGGKDDEFLFRSVLSSWDHNLHRQYISSGITQDINSGRFQVLGVPLEWLYNYAHFGRSDWGFLDTAIYGKYYVHPVLEIADSSKFKYSFKYSRNVYSYSMSLPPSICTENSMKRAMQRDLETYFGFESSIERRFCPCWALVATKGAKRKLQTKGGFPYYRQLVFHASFTARNYPFKSLIEWIRYSQQDEVIVDVTGITGNIDITMDCIPTDMQDLIKGLKANGLDLIKSKRPMLVVVIKDKKEWLHQR